MIGAYRDITADFSSRRKPRTYNSISDSNPILSAEVLDDTSSLENVFQITRSLKNELRQLGPKLDDLRKAQQECLRPTFSDSSDLENQVATKAKLISSHLDEIASQINSIILLPQESASHPDRKRIVDNIRIGLKEVHRQFSIKFQTIQQSFRVSTQRVSRLMPTQMEAPVDFASFNLGGESSERLALSQQERQNTKSLQNLASQAAEVAQMFQQLNTMIVEQGTLIDRIDYNVNETLSNAVEANKQVKKAAEYQKKSRLWICVVILGILVFILFITAIAKHSAKSSKQTSKSVSNKTK